MDTISLASFLKELEEHSLLDEEQRAELRRGPLANVHDAKALATELDRLERHLQLAGQRLAVIGDPLTNSMTK